MFYSVVWHNAINNEHCSPFDFDKDALTMASLGSTAMGVIVYRKCMASLVYITYLWQLQYSWTCLSLISKLHPWWIGCGRLSKHFPLQNQLKYQDLRWTPFFYVPLPVRNVSSQKQEIAETGLISHKESHVVPYWLNNKKKISSHWSFADKIWYPRSSPYLWPSFCFVFVYSKSYHVVPFCWTRLNLSKALTWFNG